MTEKIKGLIVSELGQMKGSYPDIPLPGDINREALGDVFFVTLPIGKINAQSRNDRRYTETAVRQMVEQINTRRPEGMWGHMTEWERGYRYDPPAMRWLAATIDSEGVAWAKGIAVTPEAREYFRIAKIANAQVGTSIYGTGEIDDNHDVLSIDLESIDLAHPMRVGVPITQAVPTLTREMEGDSKMSVDPSKLISDLTSERDALKAKIVQMETDQKTLQSLVELVGQHDVASAYRAVVEDRKNLVEALVSSMVTDMVKVAAVRPLVEQLVKTKAPVSREEARKAIEAILAQQDIKELLEKTVEATMGPKQTRPQDQKEGGPVFFEIPKSE